MIHVDNSVTDVTAGYESSIHHVKNVSSIIQKSTQNSKNNLLENKFVQIFVSDQLVLDARKNMIPWVNGHTNSDNDILQEEVVHQGLKVSANALPIAQKLQLLFDYYLNKLKQDYEANFLKENPKPILNEFLTDRENIQKVNKYHLALKRSESNWELNIIQTKKSAAQSALETLYGKPKLEYLSYDPYDQSIYCLITSSKNGFSQKIKFNLPPKNANILKERPNDVQAEMYFNFDNDELTFKGITVLFDQKAYIASLVDQTFIRQNTLKMSTENLSLNNLKVSYKQLGVNVIPPEWFLNLTFSNSEKIGYGMDADFVKAKQAALSDISEQISVKVESKLYIEKQASGDYFSNNVNQTINTSTKETTLEGTKIVKHEIKDGYNFVAVSYALENK